MRDKIISGLYGANVICFLLMACCLDSETIIPAIIMGINLLILITPLIIGARKK